MPVEEALQILYEQSAQRDVPDDEVVIVPFRERRLLRIGVIKLVSANTFRMKRLIDVERRLVTTVKYDHPDGGVVERALTGQPDALLADPATKDDPVSGAIVLDWKMMLKAPPKGDNSEHWDDAEHVSYTGYFQQRSYGFLVLRSYPAVERVRLREFYPLEGVARYATVFRSDIEHLEREFSLLIELLDRAMQGGSESGLWQPSPGKHCNYCPAPTRCPILPDERAAQGGIGTLPEAKRAAAQYVVAKQASAQLHDACKSWVNVYGPLEVKSAKGRYQLRWKPNKTGGGRSFGMHIPDDSDRGPKDPHLENAFAEVAERAKEVV